jgi:hypothetical protein
MPTTVPVIWAAVAADSIEVNGRELETGSPDAARGGHRVVG